MKNVFVFCASDPCARTNFRKTVLNAIPDESVFSCFSSDRHNELRAWKKEAGGFFAWGIKPNQRVSTMLSALETGDCLLCFFDFHYRTISYLVGKTENIKFAQMMWGSDSWSKIIFMSKPREVTVSASQLKPYLCGTYRGAARISTERINRIITDFGSVESFIEKYFG